MTNQERALLKQLDRLYTAKRQDEMGRLQNRLVKVISEAQLPSQDIYMVLTILQSQLEKLFVSSLMPEPKQEPKQEQERKE